MRLSLIFYTQFAEKRVLDGNLIIVQAFWMGHPKHLDKG